MPLKQSMTQHLGVSSQPTRTVTWGRSLYGRPWLKVRVSEEKQDVDNSRKDERVGTEWIDSNKYRGAVWMNAVIDVLRLVFFLPFKFLVIQPALWIFLRFKDMLRSPGGLVEELKEKKRKGELTLEEVAAAVKTIAKTSPEMVVAFVESECLVEVEGVGSTPVNDDVVREYIKALVRTGKIDLYGSEMKVVDGQSHGSLDRLLDELRHAAKGNPLTRNPGDTASWPLHVSLNSGALATSNGSASTLQSWFWFLATCTIIAFMWMVGTVTARRYNRVSASSMSADASTGVTSLEPKEFAKENMPQKSIKTFSDVKGCDEAIHELREVVEYLKKPEKFVRLGGKLPKGVLLTGPPGTGKTLLARAVAGEADVPFFYKSGSEFDEMFVGVGSRRVRSLFAAAKKKAPCIVFIDEIDAVGGTRTNYEASGGSRKTLNQLLTEMDGFEENSGVVVIAATNLPELLDAALTRPGRFDRHVAVALPDVEGRRSVLDLYLKDKPLDRDVDVDILARRTPGFSGADLFNMVNEAALMAATKDLERINGDCLDEARDKILMGSPRALSQSAEARKLTAYHEGGHALVALFTPGAKPIHKATIIPRGHALGMVSQVPEKDEYSTTKQQMLAHIDVCMGGKVAEEMIFGSEFVTSGATSDLKSATSMARHMVEDCGMSEVIGPMALTLPEKRSSEISKAADAEIQIFLRTAYSRVTKLLREKEKELHILASALLERETLTQKDIVDLIGAPGSDRISKDVMTTQTGNTDLMENLVQEQK